MDRKGRNPLRRPCQDALLLFNAQSGQRLANRVQLTSDGHKAYLEAVEGAAVTREPNLEPDTSMQRGASKAENPWMNAVATHAVA